VAKNVIYGRGRRKPFNTELNTSRLNTRWEDYDEVMLRSSYIGCYFFGHWLRDDCATHLLAGDDVTPMSMPTPNWPDKAGYLKLFGQSYIELDRGHIKQLVLFDDIHQNRHKANRLRRLRSHIFKNQTSPPLNHIIYLVRGKGAKDRVVINEKEIIDTLRHRGVKIIEAETMTVQELIVELYGARIIVSIEGSQLSHALYTLRDGGGVLAILEPDRFMNPHMDWTRALGMHYGVVIGERRATGLHVEVDSLLRTIDLLDAAIA
jgi:hypothetical protein